MFFLRPREKFLCSTLCTVLDTDWMKQPCVPLNRFDSSLHCVQVKPSIGRRRFTSFFNWPSEHLAPRGYNENQIHLDTCGSDCRLYSDCIHRIGPDAGRTPGRCCQCESNCGSGYSA